MTGNLTGVLIDLSGSVAVGIIALITFRDGLRARLRQARPGGGVPPEPEAIARVVRTVIPGAV